MSISMRFSLKPSVAKFGQLTTSKLRAFARDEAGVNLVEFAFAAPFLLAMLLGTSTLLEIENSSTTVGKATATVADLISQAPSVDEAAVKSAFAAAAYMTPSNAKLEVYVAGIQVDEDNGAVVLWTAANSNTMEGLEVPEVGSVYTAMPEDLQDENKFIVVTHGYMSHEPLFGANYLPGGKKKAAYEYTNYFVPRVSITTLCDECEQTFEDDDD